MGALPVRGICPVGHELNTTAPKGRVTWRGPCPSPGCGRPLIARRIPTVERDDDDAPAAAGLEAGPGDGPLVVEVAGYDDDTGPGQRFGEPGEPGDAGDDAGLPGPGDTGPGPDTGRVDSDNGAEPGEHDGAGDGAGAPAERPAGWWQRRREARRRAALEADDRQLYPGLY